VLRPNAADFICVLLNEFLRFCEPPGLRTL
jgi:hypothetical protein